MHFEWYRTLVVGKYRYIENKSTYLWKASIYNKQKAIQNRIILCAVL